MPPNTGAPGQGQHGGPGQYGGPVAPGTAYPTGQHQQPGTPTPPAGKQRYTRFNALPSALVVVGTIVAAIGVAALDWARGEPLLRVHELYRTALDQGILSGAWGNHLMVWYFGWGALVLVGLQGLYGATWTMGGVRGKVGTWIILCNSGKQLAQGRIAGSNTTAAVTAFAITVIHGLYIYRLFDGDFAAAEIGCWVTLLGSCLVTVGAGIGPRLPQRTPAQAPPRY
ncbi:hypothetical protein TL08_11440 [Actinoalloteichus hymeniacidonis]|uniref:Uncharacterized protein n=2 Tax=Actinoalloteichus hymeniacidonis TaxID=340345 RepID=A0AAC9HPC1_9PSEU|nr:hypothetical protein TL08_11440 [Actinoalloteichus hymeniacidonis]